MRAVICFGWVFQADVGQPGQASSRASELHQGGDALAVGHLGGPQQHPALSQDPQLGPGGMEADIERNAVADDSTVCHGTQSTGRAPGLQRSQVPIRAGRRSAALWPTFPAPDGMIEAVVPRDALTELEGPELSCPPGPRSPGGPVPDGYYTLRSATCNVFLFWRAFLTPGPNNRPLPSPWQA
jgi:hypothetical protein